VEAVSRFLQGLHWEAMAGGALRIVLILVLARVFLAALRAPLVRFRDTLVHRGQAQGQPEGETAKRADTLIRLIRQTVNVAVWLTVGLVILRELGVEIGPVLASAGVAGLAVGFGGQNLVRDVIAGFFLILENQVRVGDVAIINGTGGLVEQINLRTIVLRDLTGTVHVFPNGTVNNLANLTQEWSGYVFDIGVAYKEDTDRVVAVMRRVGEELKADPNFGELMLDSVEIFGVDQFADSAVIIKGRIKTRPIRQWDVGREFMRRIKKAFDEAGIEIPFPHRTLCFGEASKPFLAQLIDASGRTAEGPGVP
jgi:small-conductance mechanosensitive channel